MSKPTSTPRPPKNAIRCDCFWSNDQCYKTQYQIYSHDPTSKFFGYNRVRLPAFLKSSYNENELTLTERKKVLTVKRLAATLHISKDKLQKGMLHIAKHHWREAALDYVRNKEGQYSMTHIYEFNSREEWLEVATIIEEADIFTKEPNGQLKVFLSPNCFVGEWPALLQKLGVVSFHEQVFKRVLDKHVSSAPQDWPSLGNEFKAVDSHVDLQVDQNKLGAGSEVYDFNAQTASYNNTDSAATSKVHAKGDDRGLAGLFDANDQSASFFNADSTDYLRSYGNNIAELDTNRSITEATAQSALDEWMTMPLAEFKECEPQAVPHLGTISTASMIFHSDCNNIDTNHFNVEATNQPPADKWRTMSLRQWLGNVKYLTGENCKASTSSPGYLNASLKIALSLAEQLNLQKNDNLSHSLLNGAGSDWTEWTVVRLKDDYSEELSGYLNIDSAEIVSPKTAMKQPAAVYRIGSSHTQQIYYLGLVFYFLFSGGENPPPALLQILASFDGAFISLSTMTLVEPNEVETQTTTRLSNKRHQGPSSSKEKMGICQLSCEYLRLIGVASPLCEMLFHMLDCIYGDLAHKDRFGNISEVVDDLRLLTDKPSMFFQALDANTCSLELQLEALAIPRELEYNTLRACYHRCVAGSCQVAIIRGESGSGKSRLATMIGDNIKGEGGLFLSAKFDQMRQSLPFPALTAVFDQYCDAILDQKESGWAKPAVEKLQKVLGSDASVLALIIPKLGKILNLDCHSAALIIGANGNNAIQKLNHLLCQFVETAVTTSEVSITILLDDIQWADDASIAVIKYILKQFNQRFFFLCCCRDDEMPSNHIFWKMLDEIQSDGIQPITVQLHPMGEETQNRAMSELLCLLPRAVRPLSSIVYSRTHGNPFFFCQIMLSLYHEGSIYFDLGRGRWMWDEDKILSQKLPDSIALFLTHQICKLPVSVQSATHTLAMFGVSARVSYLKVIEDRTGLQLIEPLHQAVSERLVIYQNDAYRFSHDRIQEACYGIICGHLRQLNHLFYGRCLVQQAISTDDDTMFFSAMNQINVAGPSAVSSADESFVIAEHNLTAGKKAMQLSAFSLAYSFFDKGITFLNKDHWRHSEQRYRFSLKIYEFACQSALATGNLRSLNALLEEVMKNAKCLEDKLNAHYFRISALVNSSNILEAIEMGLAVTSKLGEHISSNPSQGDVDKNIQRTKSILHGMSDDDILSHQIMVCEKNIMLMKILARLQASAFLAKPALHSILVLRMVQISLKDGLCPASAYGFVCFGSLIAKLGDITEGYRFALLAKSLIKKFDAKESEAEVLCVAIAVQSYVEPLLSTMECLHEAESMAISVGDFYWACILKNNYVSDGLWAGVNLSQLNVRLSDTIAFMHRHNHKPLLPIMSIGQRTLNVLLGNEALSLTSDTSLPKTALMVLDFHNLYLSLLFEMDSMGEHCEAFFAWDAPFHLILASDSGRTFISGLASLKLYRQTRESLWAQRARKCIEQMKGWADQGSKYNFQHKLLLMLAEEYYANDNVNQAKECYKSAISYAQLHKFNNDAALAAELAGRFYLEIGKHASALEHFRLALDKYHDWGAVAKANQLFAYTNETFSTILSIPHDGSQSLQGHYFDGVIL